MSNTHNAIYLANQDGTVSKYGSDGDGGTYTYEACYEQTPALYEHLVDDIIYYDDHFYKVTQDIDVGDSIAVNTNIAAANLLEGELVCIDNLPSSGSSSGGGGGSSYTLPIASASTLGGVKVGTGLSIDGNTGVLSASGGVDPDTIAPTEDGATASQAYSVGKYFFHNGDLCRVTTAIASGGAITVGTNCVITTVDKELRRKTTIDLSTKTFYLNGSTGSDSNTGRTSNDPLKTIEAIDNIISTDRYEYYNVEIHFLGGTFTPPQYTFKFTTVENLTIYFDGATTIQLNGYFGFFPKNSLDVRIKANVTLPSSTSPSFTLGTAHGNTLVIVYRGENAKVTGNLIVGSNSMSSADTSTLYIYGTSQTVTNPISSCELKNTKCIVRADYSTTIATLIVDDGSVAFVNDNITVTTKTGNGHVIGNAHNAQVY